MSGKDHHEKNGTLTELLLEEELEEELMEDDEELLEEELEEELLVQMPTWQVPPVQAVPLLTFVWLQVPAPSQASLVHSLPSLVQAVPRVLAVLTGQSEEEPVQ